MSKKSKMYPDYVGDKHGVELAVRLYSKFKEVINLFLEEMPPASKDEIEDFREHACVKLEAALLRTFADWREGKR